MGFNKRWVTLEGSINALNNGRLKQYYGKSDALIFEDKMGDFIHKLYCKGKSDKEILIIINNKKHGGNNEVH
jgi:hypothetical protein